MGPDASAEDDPAGRCVTRLRAVLGCATVVMLALSWPLWTAPEAVFPRVPLVRAAAWPQMSPLLSWMLFGALLATMALAAFLEKYGRLALGASLVLLVAYVLDDQQRFQPWIYQYVALGLLLVSLRPYQALAYARWWLAGLYVYSGVSKLDVSFLHEMGPVFLAALVRPFGLHPAEWSQAWRVRAILAMPAAELVVAALLLGSRTRRLGLGGALLLHSALLVILGPWGLGHSTIVLVWNVAMMVELCVLFGPNLANRREDRSATRGRWWEVGVTCLFGTALVLPLGERLGWLDPWPAHALYASHVERTAVYLHEDEADDYPPAVRRHLQNDADSPWRRLDLTGWSRDVRGVPVYPAARVCNGLAEALAARYGGPHLVRLVHWGPADRWTGERAAVACVGWSAIHQQGERYWLNAHPVRRYKFGLNREAIDR